MELNNSNYFSPEATSKYWSVSQFKAFDKCEAAGYAEAHGMYKREETDALLIGGYVDAYFSGEMERFETEHADRMYSKRGGGLLAKFKQADHLIKRIERDSLMMNYLTGEKQVVMEAELFGVPWKVKLDVYDEQRIVDLKTVRDFASVYDRDYGGWRSWVEYWGYDIQGAIYQKVVEAVTGKRLPFYIAAITKEFVPDIKVLEIPQHILDAAYGLVEAKIERFDLIKTGEVVPMRCEKCDYCKETKRLTAPEIYEIREATDD